MLEVKVTVTLAAEVLNLFENLINGGIQPSKAKKAGDQQGKVLGYPQKEETEIEETGEESDSGTGESSVTLDDLRTIAKKLVTTEEGREKLKSVLAEMGLKKVTDVKQKDYEALHKSLAAVQGA